jgi:sarcosine oxidase, subunit gamma
MSDPVWAVRRNPLLALALPSRVGQITVTDPGPATRFECRGDAKAFGADFSLVPLRAHASAERVILHLGPDEWLVIAPGTASAAGGVTRPDLPPGCSKVDVSHRNAALVLEGHAVAAVLNAGCPLDLDVAAFPVGMCTRTVFGKAEVILWREAELRFRLEAYRSYLPYIVGLLTEAVRDVGPV